MVAAGCGGAAVDVPDDPTECVPRPLVERHELDAAPHVDRSGHRTGARRRRQRVPDVGSCARRPAGRSAPGRAPRLAQPGQQHLQRPGQLLVVAAEREAVRQAGVGGRAVGPVVVGVHPRSHSGRERGRGSAASSGAPGLPASRMACTSARPSWTGASLGRRLAQCCMAHPPATSAAPTSASRWMLRPVNARVDAGWRRRRWRRRPCRCRRCRSPTRPCPGRWCRRGWSRRPRRRPLVPTLPEREAPAAGFAVRISGTTQAAAPAVATADMRPMAWRRERRGRSKRAAPSAIRAAAPSSCGCSPSMSTPVLTRSRVDLSCRLLSDNERPGRFLPPPPAICARAVRRPSPGPGGMMSA